MNMKAIWNGEVIAQSDETISIEGNEYFPPESVNEKFLEPSKTETFCPWKGTAEYYHLNVKGETNNDAVWVYKNPKPAASEIKNYLAFWKGVEVTP